MNNKIMKMNGKTNRYTKSIKYIRYILYISDKNV